MSVTRPTACPPRRTRRPLLLATATVLVASLATACGDSTASTSSGSTDGVTGGTSGNAGTAPRRSGPACPGATGTPGGPATPAPPEAAQRRVRTSVYFLHGEQVSPAPRTVSTPATAAGSLRALLAGPDRYERDHGRTTSIPAGTRLRSIAVRGHVATIDLSGRYDDGGGTLSMRARLAQVVFTATRFPTIRKVSFELDGEPVTAFGGEGIVLDHPVGRADFEDLAPLILVESPLIGDTVRTPLRIRGSANTFEATLRLKLTDAAKRTAADVLVTATSGTGTRGTFDVTVPYKATRSGAGKLTAYWNSPKDGRPVIEDTVPLRIQR
ncbi:GerMN domain-containing protein [Streptomyces roseirectus]|uniref:GerMN domain-containing protein n=1 Tax=Streptomyces roseirectus TaxID=2768066 RepID=A0A7H0I656_9ACTN|nr:Gmad2 immunoglobulin-like domain-containing protein [Streptomyces roseirectus]QNP68272.1 GerMN domain-containing protein [Streptomyces roseirectus]